MSVDVDRVSRKDQHNNWIKEKNIHRRDWFLIQKACVELCNFPTTKLNPSQMDMSFKLYFRCEWFG